MGRITLYTGPLSMFGMKAEIALGEKHLSFEHVEVAFDNAIGYRPRHPEVVRINPKGQVPVLIDGDLEIFDSTQIFEYLEDLAPSPPLWPAEPGQRARARLLEHLSDEVYFPHVVRLMGLQEQLAEPAALTEIAAIADYCAHLDQRLANQPYLAGDYSYADIAFYMAQLFAERMGAPLTDATPNLIDWRRRVSGRAAVMPVISRLKSYLQDNKRFIPQSLQTALG